MNIILCLIFCMLCYVGAYAQSSLKPKEAKKTIATLSSASSYPTLPHSIFINLIDSVNTMVINDATGFRHIDLPKRLFNNFNSYIADSADAEIKGLKTWVYYTYTFPDGQFVNGDIYWNDTKSYIVFKIDSQRYINHFSREGVQQLKQLFKF